MEVIGAIRSRRSIRSFKAEPVPKAVLEELLDACRWAPSSSNTQPWEFAVLGGKAMEQVRSRLVEKAKAGWDSSTLTFKNVNPDIPRSGLPEPYLRRSREIRERRFSHQFPPGTEGLEEKKAAYMLAGAYCYGAPNAIIIYTDRAIYPRALFDAGLVAETICLAAPAFGLGTCLMGMLVNWPDILRELLGISDSKVLVLGIAIGYPDTEALANTFERTREPLSNLAHWHGF